MQRLSVLRLRMKNTELPKIKRLVLLSLDTAASEWACLYFNSKINPNIHWTPKLVALQLPFSYDNIRTYLSRDCYLCCSELAIIEASYITNSRLSDPECEIGEMNEADSLLVKTTVAAAPTISRKDKKRFNLY